MNFDQESRQHMQTHRFELNEEDAQDPVKRRQVASIDLIKATSDLDAAESDVRAAKAKLARCVDARELLQKKYNEVWEAFREEFPEPRPTEGWVCE